MRAAVVTGAGRIEIRTIPPPPVGPYDALVEIIACGICTGTDLHILEGNFPWLVPYPFVLGHESIGRVIRKGERVRYLNQGDLVLRPVAFRVEDHGRGLGALWGGHAEFGVVADARSILEDSDASPPRLPQFARAQQVVPADFDPVDAGMFITFKETLSWIQQLGTIANKCVAVLGTGPVGLCFVRIAKFLGANPVIAVGRRQVRLDQAMRMGADAVVDTSREDMAPAVRRLTDAHGADFIIEAIGNTALFGQATGCLADGGELAVYGVPPALETSVAWAGTVPDWKLRFIKPREETVHDLALDLVRLGFIDLRSFVSDVMPLSRIDDAFRRIADRDALKIVIAHDA